MPWEGHVRTGPQLGLSLSSLRQHLGPAENSREVLRGDIAVMLLILGSWRGCGRPLPLSAVCAAGTCCRRP